MVPNCNRGYGVPDVEGRLVGVIQGLTHTRAIPAIIRQCLGYLWPRVTHAFTHNLDDILLLFLLTIGCPLARFAAEEELLNRNSTAIVSSTFISSPAVYDVMRDRIHRGTQTLISMAFTAHQGLAIRLEKQQQAGAKPLRSLRTRRVPLVKRGVAVATNGICFRCYSRQTSWS